MTVSFERWWGLYINKDGFLLLGRSHDGVGGCDFLFFFRQVHAPASTVNMDGLGCDIGGVFAEEEGDDRGDFFGLCASPHDAG